MSAGKYGRLFTEAEMRCAVAYAATRGLPVERSPDGLLLVGVDEGAAAAAHDALAEIDRDATFPADEPLFLLRGQDKLAADTVGYYVRKCLFYLERVDPPVGEQFVGDVSAAYQAIKRWQVANPDRVKVPD